MPLTFYVFETFIYGEGIDIFLPFVYCNLSCSSDELCGSGAEHKKRQNRFVKLSEGVTSCAAHPLNGTIFAGTKVCCVKDSNVLFVLFCSNLVLII